jgi:hypothetical protein
MKNSYNFVLYDFFYYNFLRFNIHIKLNIINHNNKYQIFILLYIYKYK